MDHLHHIQKRKYPHKYPVHPHPNVLRRNVDRLVYAASLIVPGATFVQAYEIWKYEDVGGVSLITFAGYLFANFIWLAYGWLHNDRPIIVMYLLLIIFNTSIVSGILMFR